MVIAQRFSWSSAPEHRRSEKSGLALEVVGHGVTVNVVAPGYVGTGSQLDFEAAAAAAGPMGRSGTPAEIASCVAFLAHESASFVTGAVLVADGGHGLPETWPAPRGG